MRRFQECPRAKEILSSCQRAITDYATAGLLARPQNRWNGIREDGMVITSSPGGRNRLHNHDPCVDLDLVVYHKAHGHVRLHKGHRRNHGAVVELRKGPLCTGRRVVGSHRQLLVVDHDALEVESEVDMARARGGRNSPEADYACGNHHDEDCIRVEDHDDHSSNRLVEDHHSRDVVEESGI